jgi:hypothetical protein
MRDAMCAACKNRTETEQAEHATHTGERKLKQGIERMRRKEHKSDRQPACLPLHPPSVWQECCGEEGKASKIGAQHY